MQRLVSSGVIPASLPVVANLRCGAWYVPPPPQARRPFCYFKSTDGHANEWSFSLKRPNLEVLAFIQAKGGVVIVDSTRRGKSMPDALSKTIPIWCAVLNEASRRKWGQPSTSLQSSEVTFQSRQAPYRDVRVGPTGLTTPAHQVPPSEHAQMEERFEGWVESLLGSDLPVPKLDRPLVPCFVTRGDHDDGEAGQPLRSDCYPVILVSASRRVEAPVPSEDGKFYYVQGSGDDEEAWSHGLTPDEFWQERETLLRCGSREELEEAIDEVVQRGGAQACHNGELKDVQISGTAVRIGVRPEGHVFTAEERARHALIVDLCGIAAEEEEAAGVVRLKIPAGKAGVNALRSGLSEVVSQRSPAKGDVLVVDTTLSDASLAIVVALLACHYDSERGLVVNVDAHRLALTKDDVRRRLQWVQQDLPGANPSRSAMQRVNEVVLQRPGGR